MNNINLIYRTNVTICNSNKHYNEIQTVRFYIMMIHIVVVLVIVKRIGDYMVSKVDD